MYTLNVKGSSCRTCKEQTECWRYIQKSYAEGAASSTTELGWTGGVRLALKKVCDWPLRALCPAGPLNEIRTYSRLGLVPLADV